MVYPSLGFQRAQGVVETLCGEQRAGDPRGQKLRAVAPEGLEGCATAGVCFLGFAQRKLSAR